MCINPAYYFDISLPHPLIYIIRHTYIQRHYNKSGAHMYKLAVLFGWYILHKITRGCNNAELH